ncbi:MAG: hypothetical protein GFH27_549279n412 [Chloroflexi bacterium AL-W]|nr:hypothetical protein [Chloroflexi bacterium AL-N1]NOK65378.1 hypothetical protein [Chloroflexi bacterium AL-N10]NOK72356.1 hypothetical protein [Chloroflexi bacterium AL-N5]NOK79557.1 hypothetical protein [Chloroflexi bacterium AL-W]NOK87473.1 hypothetical protein [Chloroflexi bacterium AL-N15]
MRHPYSWLESKTYPTLRNILICMLILVIGTNTILLAPLLGHGPHGLLAGRIHTPNIAEQMQVSWGDSGLLLASVGLGYDFLFLMNVSTLVALGCVMMANMVHWAYIQRLGYILAWGALLAGACDWVETTLTVQLLVTTQPAWMPQLILTLSNIKFTTIGLSLLYLLLTWITRQVTLTIADD